LKGASCSRVPFRATGWASDKTGRTTRPTARHQQRSSRSKGSYGSDVSSSKQSKIHGLLDEGLGICKHDPRAGRPELRGHSRSKEDKKPSFKRLRLTRGSAGPPRPEKPKATTLASRTKLTIRDPFDEDTGVRHGVSASPKPSKAGHEKILVTSPDASKPETMVRSRKTMRRPRVTTKGFDLGTALLNPAPEPMGTISDHRGAPNASMPDSDQASARPRTKQSQKSSLGKSLLDIGSPASSGGRPSPKGSGLWNTKAGEPGPKTRGSDTRKTGKNMSSPLPPSDADLGSGRAKMRDSYKAQGAKQAGDSKPPPA